MNDDETPPKVVNLHESEWSSPDRPEPFWGPRWWVVPAFFALVAILTAMGASGSPWMMIIARSL